MSEPISIVKNQDCMQFMAEFPDKFFDLAIVDPPYGIEKQISIGGGVHTKSRSKFHNLYNQGAKWDRVRPNSEYWNQLFRVTKNQIICGANYFANHLPISRGWVVWDKQGDGMTSVNNELIFTSFDIAIKNFRRCHALDKGFQNKEGTNIHPTQKPIALYKWLLTNYAKQGDKILDTHLGSGSSRIAAHDLGFDFYATELDKDYFEAQEKRFGNHCKQPNLLIDVAPMERQDKLF